MTMTQALDSCRLRRPDTVILVAFRKAKARLVVCAILRDLRMGG